jgi:hypothetical protein
VLLLPGDGQSQRRDQRGGEQRDHQKHAAGATAAGVVDVFVRDGFDRGGRRGELNFVEGAFA